jgi:biotin transporter BioY
MQKLVLLSVIIATFGVPVLLERRTGGRTGFGLLLGVFAGFTAAYVFALIFIYPRLF